MIASPFGFWSSYFFWLQQVHVLNGGNIYSIKSLAAHNTTKNKSPISLQTPHLFNTQVSTPDTIKTIHWHEIKASEAMKLVCEIMTWEKHPFLEWKKYNFLWIPIFFTSHLPSGRDDISSGFSSWLSQSSDWVTGIASASHGISCLELLKQAMVVMEGCMSSQFPFSHQLSSYGNGYVDHSAEKASEALYRLGGKEFLILYQSIPWLVRWKKKSSSTWK